MAGYADFSKSNNAVDAEKSGRFPASEAAKRLGLPTGFVRDCCQFATNGEWHHTSKFYNRVSYYDTAIIERWMDGDAEGMRAMVDEPYAAAMSAWRAKQVAAKANPVIEHTNVTVTWLEWGGTRNHPRAVEKSAVGCTIRDSGGKFVAVVFADKREMRRGRDTTGFSAKYPDGRSVHLDYKWHLKKHEQQSAEAVISEPLPLSPVVTNDALLPTEGSRSVSGQVKS